MLSVGLWTYGICAKEQAATKTYQSLGKQGKIYQSSRKQGKDNPTEGMVKQGHMMRFGKEDVMF